MRRVWVVLVAMGWSAAWGDATAPKGSCATPPEVVKEIERMLKVAVSHASRSHLCVDGDGQETVIDGIAMCATGGKGGELSVAVSYQVTMSLELGGECSPYPECAEAPPPEKHEGKMVVRVAPVKGGRRVVVPREVGGVELLTALDRAHDGACKGNSAAYVPKLLKK